MMIPWELAQGPAPAQSALETQHAPIMPPLRQHGHCQPDSSLPQSHDPPQATKGVVVDRRHVFDHPTPCYQTVNPWVDPHIGPQRFWFTSWVISLRMACQCEMLWQPCWLISPLILSPTVSPAKQPNTITPPPPYNHTFRNCPFTLSTSRHDKNSQRFFSP